jgi:hypothetical protein
VHITSTEYIALIRSRHQVTTHLYIMHIFTDSRQLLSDALQQQSLRIIHSENIRHFSISMWSGAQETIQPCRMRDCHVVEQQEDAAFVSLNLSFGRNTGIEWVISRIKWSFAYIHCLQKVVLHAPTWPRPVQNVVLSGSISSLYCQWTLASTRW